MEPVDLKLGDFGSLEVQVTGEDVVVTVDAKVGGGIVDCKVSFVVHSVEALDKLKGLIPGKIDDAIIDIVKAGLAALGK